MSYSLFYPHVRLALKLFALLFFMLNITACSDDSDSDDDDDILIPSATQVIGQGDYLDRQPNRGGSVSAVGLAQPRGGVSFNGSAFFIPDTGNSRILGYSSIPEQQNVPADFVIGQAGFESGVPGTAADKLAFPDSVSISDSKLLVADTGNHRVLIWNTVPSSNTAASRVIGQSGFSTATRGTSAGQLSSPADAIIVDSKLIVVDRGNNRVLIWDAVPTSNGQAADIVLGQEDFISSTAKSGAQGMNSPSSVWTDGFRLLVADTGNSRVLVWNQMPTTNAEPADSVIGQSTFTATTATIGNYRLNRPEFVFSDGLRIFIADTGNNRVVATNSFPVVNGMQFDDDYLYGQDDFSNKQANDADQDATIDEDAAATTLYSPTGVSIAGGRLYITDRNNHRVLGFN